MKFQLFGCTHALIISTVRKDIGNNRLYGCLISHRSIGDFHKKKSPLIYFISAQKISTVKTFNKAS